MIAEGNKIIESNKVADPASSIAQRLSSALAAKHSATVATSKVFVATADVAQIAREAKQAARFAIDVRTVTWGFMYSPTNRSRYRVFYAAKASLLATETGSILAEGFCKQMPESDAGAATYDELLASEAALLKRRLEEAADECLKTLRSEMLSL